MTTLTRFTLFLVLAALAGCRVTTSDQPGEQRKEDPLNPWLYKDRATGCEYLTSRNDNALTPRIAADGKTHVGCKGAQP